MSAEWSPAQRNVQRQFQSNYRFQVEKHRVYCTMTNCSGAAWYAVGKKLYCEQHREVAVAAAKREWKAR